MLIALMSLEEPLRPTRALQPDAVAALAASIERLGLRTPITVRAAKSVRAGREADVWEIVTGRHRVAAARKLGWTEIEAVASEGSEEDARLWEIAENLHRADLTVAERSGLIAEWMRLTGVKVSAKLAETPNPKGGRPGAIDAARKELGLSEGEARRAVKIASLPQEAKEAAVAAGLDDNQTALLRAAASPSPVAELAAIKREREIAEAHKRNSESDRLIAKSEADFFAEWLLARMDTNELPQVVAWIEAAKAKDITAALRRKAA